MKLVKLSIFALAMGLFVASCGSSEPTETPEADTAIVAPEAAPAPAPAPVDTMAAPAVDTTAAAPAAH